MNLIRLRSRDDAHAPPLDDALTSATPQAAPPTTTSEATGVVAAVAPEPTDPEHDTVDAYPHMRTLQASATVSWPTRMDTSRIGIVPAPPVSKSELRRVWVEGQRPPMNPPSPAEHAIALLRWLQSQPIFAGNVIPACDLERLYPAFCTALGLYPWPWQTLARHLRRLTGGRKHYRRVNGDNVRVYFIPLPEGSWA